MIPKKHTIIAYDLIYNPIINDIEYQEVYVTARESLIRLNTHEYIVNTPTNRKYLKKFNNKWYIKEDFKLADKKQLTFAFMSKK